MSDDFLLYDYQDATKAIRTIIKFLEPNTSEREGLQDTPNRVVLSLLDLTTGYQEDNQTIKEMLTTFESPTDEIVVLKDIEFCSLCEHHMLPFLGSADIAYIPNGRVVGISKLARLLEVFARRLQMQERICQQVSDALMEHLKPKAAACIIEAKHLCISCRGVNKQHSVMVTSCVRGAFHDDPTSRQELMALIRR